MRRFRSRWYYLAGTLSLLAGLAWYWGPFASVFAISRLASPARLATLGERGANPRLNKIVYWIEQARFRGLAPETSVQWALKVEGVGEPRASLVSEALLRNHRIARELGLLTPENLPRLRRGQAAMVTRGPYRGESVEIDHIVPLRVAPELGNELANLEMLPRGLNRRKSDHVGERQLAHARRLHQAGLLSLESMNRLQAGSASLPRKRPAP
jgi:hypothetical protein